MKGNSEEARKLWEHSNPPTVGEVGREPSNDWLTGHAYLKGKI